MKPVYNFLNRTPWWLLLGGGLVLFVGLALFTTPVHLMRLDESGKTPEANSAIKRESDDARTNLREAGVEVLRAKRQAAEDATQAVKEATAAIEEAQRQAAKALKE